MRAKALGCKDSCASDLLGPFDSFDVVFSFLFLVEHEISFNTLDISDITENLTPQIHT